MAVDRAFINEVRALAALPGDSPEHLRVFETIPELIGYIIETARADGLSEADQVEVFCRAAELTRGDLLDAHRVLRPLGYVAVCKVLKRLSRLKRCH